MKTLNRLVFATAVALAFTSCATTESTSTIYGREMTHREAKEEGYDFWERNQDEWWAQPAMVWKGLRQFGG